MGTVENVLGTGSGIPGSSGRIQVTEGLDRESGVLGTLKEVPYICGPPEGEWIADISDIGVGFVTEYLFI